MSIWYCVRRPCIIITQNMCSNNSLRQNILVILRFLMILLLNPNTQNINHCRDLPRPTLTNLSTCTMEASVKAINLIGRFDFHDTEQAASDFGNRYHSLPMAILYPKAVSDISSTVKHVFDLGSSSELTVAARGHGHSLHGQAQAPHGIVINMESLQEPKMHVHIGDLPIPYVDVSGGLLWIDILHETLKYGFAPRSWTDYLHLTVGGTLSNAGMSGQAFRHGPQINNVRQLEVVTGRGDVVTCSDKQEADLFYAVLGGLGQFGIITRARILLEPAPKTVRWIRVLYSDFYSFTKDQEYLISLENSFDYVEGFVIINRTGLVNNWRSSFNPRDPLQASLFISEGRTLYCLEMAKYISPDDNDAGSVDQRIDNMVSKLAYMPHTLFLSEVSYVEFLDRVHLSEIKLRRKGLWDVPHPWLNLLVPRSSIYEFAKEVFGNILVENSNGPILIYPVNQSRWNENTSMITPEEDVFYLVAFLSSAVPSPTGTTGLRHMLTQNKRILDFCGRANLGVKQYLPHYRNQEEWKTHFGTKWELFARRKLSYDPLAILAPGQRIFQKAHTIS